MIQQVERPDEVAPDNDNQTPRSVRLELLVEDPQAVAQLVSHPEGRPRHAHASTALRIGLLALEQARGQIDTDSVRREGERILSLLDEKLSSSSRELHGRIAGTMTDYFDPQSGRFSERVGRLVDKDGELEQILSRAVGGQDSELVRTLVGHMGENSPVMQLLDPASSTGVLAAMQEVLCKQLAEQKIAVLRQFSLDDKDSALRRLVEELETSHGKLEGAVEEKVAMLVREFSADEDGSALNRLIKRVELAQKTITSEFSLDNGNSALARLKQELDQTRSAIHSQLTLDDDGSPLSRLRRELLEVLGKQQTESETFQLSISQMVSELVGKKNAEAKGTQHGHTFEEAMVVCVQERAIQQGHIAEATGHTTGRVRNCKKGDLVLEIGPEHAASEARIVWEAKQDASYTLKKARDEMAQARLNRDSDIGVFVFSKKTAPETMPAFHRIGDDIFIVWDAEDAASDVILDAALAASTALSIRRVKSDATLDADLDAIERAVIEIEKRVGNLAEVQTWAKTIKSNSEKILKRIDTDRDVLQAKLGVLKDRGASLRGALTK